MAMLDRVAATLLQTCAKSLLIFYSLPVAIRMPLGLASCTHATLRHCLGFPHALINIAACTSNVTTQSLNNSNTAYEIHCIILPITDYLGNCQMNQLKTHAMFQVVYQSRACANAACVCTSEFIQVVCEAAPSACVQLGVARSLGRPQYRCLTWKGFSL